MYTDTAYYRNSVQPAPGPPQLPERMAWTALYWLVVVLTAFKRAGSSLQHSAHLVEIHPVEHCICSIGKRALENVCHPGSVLGQLSKVVVSALAGQPLQIVLGNQACTQDASQNWSEAIAHDAQGNDNDVHSDSYCFASIRNVSSCCHEGRGPAQLEPLTSATCHEENMKAYNWAKRPAQCFAPTA